jgi:catechol 2,3-dioxygenase-like lactoylglutathione lyase family enzyme
MQYAETMREKLIIGLHHVQLAMPIGGEDVARAFYCGVLGLVEVEKPEALSGRGGIWCDGPGLRLHLGVEDPFRPARKAHPALQVADLDAAHSALAGHDATAISALPGLRRFYISDPFGNRIEILQSV